jgi:hypothetical protein
VCFTYRTAMCASPIRPLRSASFSSSISAASSTFGGAYFDGSIPRIGFDGYPSSKSASSADFYETTISDSSPVMVTQLAEPDTEDHHSAKLTANTSTSTGNRGSSSATWAVCLNSASIKA